MYFQSTNFNAAKQMAIQSGEVDEGTGTAIHKFHFVTGIANTFS